MAYLKSWQTAGQDQLADGEIDGLAGRAAGDEIDGDGSSWTAGSGVAGTVGADRGAWTTDGTEEEAIAGCTVGAGGTTGRRKPARQAS